MDLVGKKVFYPLNPLIFYTKSVDKLPCFINTNGYCLAWPKRKGLRPMVNTKFTLGHHHPLETFKMVLAYI